MSWRFSYSRCRFAVPFITIFFLVGTFRNTDADQHKYGGSIVVAVSSDP